MKKILVFILFIGFWHNSEAYSSQELLDWCSEYNNFVTNKSEEEFDKVTSQKCISYIEGALDKIILFYAEYDNYAAYICLPENISQPEIISVVYKALTETKDLHFGAQGAIAASVAKAYPCEINRTESEGQ